MRLEEMRDPEHRATVFTLVLTDDDVMTVPLDAFDRLIINSPKEYPIADTLQNLQLIAFRLEQAHAAVRPRPADQAAGG